MSKINVAVRWSSVENESTIYNIQMFTDHVSNIDPAIFTTQKQHFEFALEKNHSYGFRVQAENNQGKSDFSKWATIDLVVPPSIPTDVVVEVQ